MARLIGTLSAGAALAAILLIPPAGAQTAAQQTPSTTVAPLNVAPAAAPNVGKGAPAYTVDELTAAHKAAQVETHEAEQNARTCQLGHTSAMDMGAGPPSLEGFYRSQFDAASKAANLADRAAKATAAAVAARVAAGAAPDDAAKAKAAADTELARQTAVNAYVKARKDMEEASAEIADLADIMRRDENLTDDAHQASALANRALQWRGEIGQRRQEREANGGQEAATGDAEFADLSFTQMTAQPGGAGKSAFVRVSGLIHNPRAKPINAPPVQVVAMDQAGVQLASFSTEPDRSRTIPAGGDMAFAYDVKPAPQRAAGFVVGFGFGDPGATAKGAAGYFCSGSGDTPPGATPRGIALQRGVMNAFRGTSGATR